MLLPLRDHAQSLPAWAASRVCSVAMRVTPKGAAEWAVVENFYRNYKAQRSEGGRDEGKKEEGGEGKGRG